MSIYLRPATDGRAKFRFFNTEITSDHIKKGYWRFNVEEKGEDDLKAHSQGFMCPEALLDAAASGQEYPSDISLKWIPGEDDTYKAVRVGTVQEHMRCIAEERMIFGLPASFQDETPTYPVDNTGKLFKHRTNNNTPSFQDGRVIARYTKQQAEAKHQSSLQAAIARRAAEFTNSASPLLVANTRSSMATKASQKRRNLKSSEAESSKVPNPPSQLKSPSLTNSLGMPPPQNKPGNNATDKFQFILPAPKTTNSQQAFVDDPDNPHNWSHYKHLYLPHLYVPPAASPAPENSNDSLEENSKVPRTLAISGNTVDRQHKQQDKAKNRNDLAGSAAYPINLEKDLKTIGSPLPFECSSAGFQALHNSQKHSVTPSNDFQSPTVTSKNNAPFTPQMTDGHKLMSQSPQPTKGLIQRSSQTSLKRSIPEQTPSKVSVAPQINVGLPTSSEQPQERASLTKPPLKQGDAVNEPITLPSMSPALQSIAREISSLSLSSKVSAWLDVTTDTNQDEMLSPMATPDHLSAEPAVTKESAPVPASQTSKISTIPYVSPQKTSQKSSVATSKTQSWSLHNTPTGTAKQAEQPVTANTAPVVNLDTDFSDPNAFMDRVLPLSEDVPCFDCGGTAFHTYDCHIGRKFHPAHIITQIISNS